jgi:hypothetical protein
VAVVAPAARGEVVWHDPWLNWDFLNNLGITVNDFAIIVDDPSGTFDPDPNDPEQQWAMPFPEFRRIRDTDWDGDGDLDTMLKWLGADVDDGMFAHGGLYMKGSGLVLDAFWTKDCRKVGWSTPITYELTEIRGDPEVHMHLQMAPGFFEDSNHPDAPNQEAGWTEIRTFLSLPADLLDLEDLNKDLDLDALAAMDYEVTPKYG